MQWQWALPPLGALAALVVSCGSHAQDIRDTAQQFLQGHGVPCLVVLKVDGDHEFGEVATCQDGREWILLWTDNEIAFVVPEPRQAYRWQRDVYLSYPQLYSREKHGTRNPALISYE